MPLVRTRPLWFWPVLVACVVLMYGVVLTPANAHIPLWLAGSGALIALYFGVSRYERSAKRLQRMQDSASLRELIHRASSGETITFHSSGGLFYLVLLAAMAVVFTSVMILEFQYPLFFACLISWVGAIAMGLRAISGFGKPALVITSDGIKFSAGHSIAWNEISGLYLHERRSRRVLMWHELAIHAPNLRDKLPSMNWAGRMFFRLFVHGRNAAVQKIFLRNSDESPEMIYRLCEHVWRAHTGRSTKSYLGPYASKEMLEFESQVQSLDYQIKEHMRNGRPKEAAQLIKQMSELRGHQLEEMKLSIYGNSRTQRAFVYVLFGVITAFVVLYIVFGILQIALD